MKLGITAMLAALGNLARNFTGGADTSAALDSAQPSRHERQFYPWLAKKLQKQDMPNTRRYPKPGFVVSRENGGQILGRAAAPWTPNKKGMRIENGKYIPRHS